MKHCYCIFGALICGGVLLISPIIGGKSYSIDYRTGPAEMQHILYVGGINHGNYSTIQDAVDNASTGDIVFVYDDSSPYYENIVIRTQLQLIGENPATTSIEGGNYAISIHADGVTVRGFRISNVGDFWNCCGFYITSDENIISDNTIINNQRMNGVYLYGSSYNTISGNLLQNNKYHAIRLEYATHNVITENVIVDNRGYGIYLAISSDNLIVGNTIVRSFWEGLMVGNQSENNTLFHNTLIDNLANANDDAGNIWDNGSSGNYWSDYNGSDSDGDGIGDSPYQIPGGMAQDRYPLMEPYQKQIPDLTIAFTFKFGYAITVKNVGTTLATNIGWASHLSGGLIIIPSEHDHYGVIPLLAPGEEFVIEEVPLMVGIGLTTVQVSAGNATASLRGLVMFFFFLPLSE